MSFSVLDLLDLPPLERAVFLQVARRSPAAAEALAAALGHTPAAFTERGGLGAPETHREPNHAAGSDLAEIRTSAHTQPIELSEQRGPPILALDGNGVTVRLSFPVD